jgi:LPS sulfotransferase NodH
MPSRPGLFAVLSTQRCGSGWLIDVLNHHPEIDAAGELFRRENDGTYGAQIAEPYHLSPESRYSWTGPWRFVARIARHPGRPVFKLMYDQARANPAALAYLLLRRQPIIHLVRENQLDVLISWEIVQQQTGTWHLQDPRQDVARDIRIVLDPGSLIAWLDDRYRRMAQARRLLTVLRHPHLEVSYEAMVQVPKTFDQIWSFLGVRAVTPETRQRKIRQQTHREVITNYAEVEKVLRETPYARLLEN